MVVIVTKKEIKARAKSTPQAIKLSDALQKNGIKTYLELSDRHKHIDIAIPKYKLNIEVDGNQHFLNAKQIERDFARSYWSSDKGYDTLHIPNFIVDNHFDAVVKAITEVIRGRKEKE